MKRVWGNIYLKFGATDPTFEKHCHTVLFEELC